jgi:superfamily II DNA or RNA helicase
MLFDNQAIDLATSDLREAQLGALHAVAAHFAWSDESAQVVLPTGVGKTVVATLLPFLLRTKKKVLVVAPARIVRDQLIHEFETLKTAKSLRALPDDVPAPTVYPARRRMAEWAVADDFDVIVGTPHVLSSGNPGVAPLDPSSFGLAIFDEAHHLPAPTWSSLYGDLSGIKRILLTATPIRRDRRRLPGELAFTYPLRRAIAAKSYRPVRFVGVDPVPPADRDLALAKVAAERLESDEHRDAHSRLLVRTDRQEHATQLVDVYASVNVTVKKVLGRTAGSTVRSYLKRLGPDGDLDGLVVVGAMTEGFDFPRLKIASYHQPHRALAPTLQFVGRLARAGDMDGEVVAFAEDVSDETAELFREDAVWEDILPKLVDTAVDEEKRLREFTSGLSTLGGGLHQISALGIAPPRSTHIFRMPDPPDFSYDPGKLGGGEVIERFRHSSDDFVAYLTRRRLHPRFMRDDALDSSEHHLHVATWVEDPGLLFISTDLSSALKAIRAGVSNGGAMPVGAGDLSRLLAAAKLEQCFSVGARPTSIGTATNESYRQYSGRRAELSLNPSDARALVLGHVMGRMSGTGSGSGTFGFSSKKAKLWEPTPTASLADFRKWCEGHAKVLKTGAVAGLGNASLDFLGLPDRLIAFPDAPAIAVLPFEIIMGDYELFLNGAQEELLAIDIAAERLSSATMRLTLSGTSGHCQIDLGVDCGAVTVVGSAVLRDPQTLEKVDVAVALEDDPPTLLFGDGTWVFGDLVIKPPVVFEPLPTSARVPLDWRGVNTTLEFVEPLAATTSVAGRTHDWLLPSTEWLIQDHLPGELADFIAIREIGDRVEVDLVHCKKPDGANPSTRVTDIQELLAQGMRSMYLATAGTRIWTELIRRINSRAATKVLKTNEAAALVKLAEWEQASPIISWRITCVQPGIADGKLEGWTEGNALMVSASDVCKRQGVAFRVVNSV